MKEASQQLKGTVDRGASTKYRVLESACFLFSEVGLRGTHLRDICKRAGVNVAAICYHFHGKGALYEAAAKKAGCQLAAQADGLKDWIDNATPEEGLRMIVAALFRNLGEDHAWIAKLAVRELTDNLAEGGNWVGSGLEKHFALLQRLIKELLGPGADREAIRLHSLSVISQCVFYSVAEQNLHRAFPRLQWPLPNQETLARHVVTQALAALQSEAQMPGVDPQHGS